MATKNGDGWHRSRTFMGGAIIAARGERRKMAKKNWRIDAGNSTDGQIGFTVTGIKAETAEDALALVKAELLTELHRANFTTANTGRWEVNVYFNTDTLTLDNVEEDVSEIEQMEADLAEIEQRERQAQPHCPICGCDLHNGLCPEGHHQEKEDDEPDTSRPHVTGCPRRQLESAECLCNPERTALQGEDENGQL